jgi:23S rRNA (adenine2503-C2)-methyltransferase
MSKIVLTGLLPQEITSLLDLKQSFRGKQIFKWIGNGVSDFDKMTNLSLELREDLKEKAILRSSTVSQVLKDPDGTIKLQITLQVSCKESHRHTACRPSYP